MYRLRHFFVCIRRLAHSYGFGIQSPTDYAFVRYVVNEHWPYYAYEKQEEVPWLQQKLGRLYFRLANWRQPSAMIKDEYQHFWEAGCRKTRFIDVISQVELARIDVADVEGWERLLPLCNERSAVVVENIYRDWQRWHDIEQQTAVGTTFDLYLCGIVFFDIKRAPHHYIINF